MATESDESGALAPERQILELTVPLRAADDPCITGALEIGSAGSLEPTVALELGRRLR